MDVEKVQAVAATVIVAVSTVFVLIWGDLSLKGEGPDEREGAVICLFGCHMFWRGCSY